MPKIPEFFVPSVEESPVRMPQAQGQQVVPYQPVQLEQLGKLAESMEAAGTGLSRAFAVIQDDENDAIAKDLDLQLKLKLDDMLENPQSGFLAATGPNAGLDQYNKIVGDAQSVIESSFADFKDGGKYERDYYKTAHGMYKGVAMQRLDAFKSRAAEHTRASIRDYASKMSEARWMMHSDDAAKFRNDPTALEKALIAARSEAGQIATRAAGPDASTPEYQAIFKTKMGQTHSAVITNYLIGDNPDVDSANKYLEAHGSEMLEQDRGKLQEETQKRAPIAEGFKAFREVMKDSTLTSFEKRRERLTEMVEGRKISSTKAYDDAMQRLDVEERRQERDTNAGRADTWMEFNNWSASNQDVKSYQELLRKDPGLASKLEYFNLTDNVERALKGQKLKTYEDVEEAYTKRSAAELASVFSTEEDLRRALAGRADTPFIESTVLRWASVSKAANKEQAAAGKSHATLLQMAAVSLEKQNIWDVIDTGQKGQPTKEVITTKYLMEAEGRARLKKKDGSQPSEMEVLAEMKAMEESQFATLDVSDTWFSWDGPEVSMGGYAFKSWLESDQVRKTNYDTIRFKTTTGKSVSLTIDDLVSEPVVFPEGKDFQGQSRFANTYEALLAMNKYKQEVHNEQPFDLTNKDEFAEAYRVYMKSIFGKSF